MFVTEIPRVLIVQGHYSPVMPKGSEKTTTTTTSKHIYRNYLLTRTFDLYGKISNLGLAVKTFD